MIYDPVYSVSKKSKSEKKLFSLDEDKLKMRRTNRTCYLVYCVKLKRKDTKVQRKEDHWDSIFNFYRDIASEQTR